MMTVPALLGGLLLPWCGFMFGCFASIITRRTPPDVTAIAIETGIQNTGIAILVLKPVHNHQNRRQLLKKGQQKTSAARTISRRHFPASVMVSTIAVCEELFPGFWSRDIWPSNSPDLNPMDYSVWSIMEQKISTTRYATVEQLKSALLRSWDEITAEQCATIISDFPKRLRKCIEAKGGNFEHLL
ncbi:unnamed protein product [Heligmosomoides polygyrus]|uniref:DDE-1 domain-containing protein n=1 Tax=Heligmosomoides polygyrus TaxID=6339 RepID=A0A183FFQ6_HELPZ|nr:unnamed protein product [Heligmosomoides polygyrus]